jgi:polysaccharide pyruvyl transferase WcaK-like protein
MPTALLLGASGQRNPGDDAVGAAFGAALPGWRTLRVTSPPGRPGNGDRARSTVDVGAPPAVARALVSSDALVVAGGTVFKTLDPGSGRRSLSLLRRAVALLGAARMLGKPRAMVGVGAGVLDSATSRRLARALVFQSDLLVLRDEESADVLAAAGAPTPFRVGADAAWTLLEPPPSGPRAPGGPIVVALGVLAGDASLPAHLAAALAPLIEAGHDVRLQPWDVTGNGIDDLALGEAVNERLPRRLPLLGAPANLPEARRLFTEAGLVVGLRFHALVAAAAAGTRFVAYGHEPKHAGLARRLGQRAVGTGESSAALTRAILDGFERPAPSRATVESQIEGAQAGMQLLRVLLAGRDAPAEDEIDGLPFSPAS